MKWFLSKELTDAFLFIKSHPDFKKTLAWKHVPEEKRNVIQNSHRELKTLINDAWRSMPEAALDELKCSMGMWQNSGNIFPHIWGAVIPQGVDRPNNSTSQLYVSRVGESVRVGIGLSDSLKDNSQALSIFKHHQHSIRNGLESVLESFRAGRSNLNWQIVDGPSEIKLTCDASHLNYEDFAKLLNQSFALLSQTFLAFTEGLRSADILDEESEIEKEQPVSTEKQVRIEPSLQISPNAKFWKISCGLGGKFAGVHRESKRISIGWSERNLTEFQTKEELQKHFEGVTEYEFDAGHAARQSWCFARDISVGDYIFGYGSSSVLLVGKVTRGYTFSPPTEWAKDLASKIDTDHCHTLEVEWLDTPVIKKSELTATLQKRLATVQTLLQLSETEGREILSHISGEVSNSRTGSSEVDSKLIRSVKTGESIAREYGLKVEFVNSLRERLETKGQIVFQGPPGTGKTLIAQAIADWMQPQRNKIRRVQFHPSYAYEDFVEGVRPRVNGSDFGFERKDGVFKEFCIEAMKSPREKFVFIIDEMNRGNLPLVFGELLSMIEYRDQEVTLPYSNSSFVIPANVFLICTMNTADRSLALLDFAIRRRFDFIQMPPSRDALLNFLKNNNSQLDPDEVAKMFDATNAFIEEHIGSEFCFGHSFWMVKNLTEDKLRSVWKHNLLPTMREYFFDRPQDLEGVNFESFAQFGRKKLAG